MANNLDAIVDNWYFHLDKGQRFYVVAVDAENELIELQHFDGDLEEISLNEWRRMDIALAEEPASWYGATDISEADDFGTEVTDTSNSDWNEGLREYPTPSTK